MYICMYMYIYTHKHTRTRTHTYTHTYTPNILHTYIYTYTLPVHTHTYTYRKRKTYIFRRPLCSNDSGILGQVSRAIDFAIMVDTLRYVDVGAVLAVATSLLRVLVVFAILSSVF